MTGQSPRTRRLARRSRPRERGIALFLALLVLVLLSIIIVQMTASSVQTKTTAENHVSDLQNSYALRAGYYQALLYLQTDLEEAPDVDTLAERWAQPLEFDLGRAHVQVVIQDSERFVSLAQLVDDQGVANPTIVAQLHRLVRILGHPPDVADRIVDYVDADSKGAFEAQAKNDRLWNPEELLRIEGITPEVVYGGTVDGLDRKGLVGFVTPWPLPSGPAAGAPPAAAGSATTPAGTPPASGGTPAAPGGATPGMVAAGAINVNTASSEVLQSLADEMTPTMAAAIMAARSAPGPDGLAQGFKTLEDLKKVSGLSGAAYDAIAPQLTVKSSTFEIRVKSQIGTLEKSWVFIVRRGGGQGAGITLLGSQRLNDFLTVRPPGSSP
jgi:type II secretory pathway component PulK